MGLTELMFEQMSEAVEHAVYDTPRKIIQHTADDLRLS